MTLLLAPMAVVAAVVSAVTALHALRRRGSLATPVAGIMAAATVWSLLDVLLYTLPTVEARAVLPTLFVPVASALSGVVLVYGLRLAGQGRALTTAMRTLLVLVPLAWLALAVSPERELLLRPTGMTDGLLTVELGPLFGVHLMYSYVLLVTAFGLLGGAVLRAVSGQRRGYLAVLAALALPLLANAASTTTSATGFTDLTPGGFLLAALLWAWAEQHPETRSGAMSTRQVIGALGDAVLVTDPTGLVVEANPAAHALVRAFGGERRWALGSPVRDVLPVGLVLPTDGRPRQGAVTALGGRRLDIRSAAVAGDDDDEPMGFVVVVRDVTDVERAIADQAEMATRDPLTGLHNRRHLDDALPAVVLRAAATGAPLSALVVDVDHFKSVNDRFGHGTGDEVLVAVARAVASVTRPPDLVVRWGGEEFLVVLPGTAGESAVGRAEELRRRCAALTFRSAPGLSLTVSVGVAELRYGEDAQAWLARADAYLYVAKNSGRNRVVGEGDVPSSAVRGALRR